MFVEMVSSGKYCHAIITLPNINKYRLHHKITFKGGSLEVIAKNQNSLEYKINNKGDFKCITNNFKCKKGGNWESTTKFGGLRVIVTVTEGMIIAAHKRRKKEKYLKLAENNKSSDNIVSLGYVHTNQRTKANYKYTNVNNPYRGGGF